MNFKLNDYISTIKSTFQEIFPKDKRFHSPTKNISTWIIDNAVTKNLSEYEIVLHQNLKRWYKQSIINISIVALLILSGVLTYAFTDKTGILKLLVALAYLFSIIIFIYRRILNIMVISRNRNNIASYAALCIKGLSTYEYGQKLKLILFDVYLRLYSENVSINKAKVHKIAAKLHIVPDQKEVFEIIYARFILFFWNVVYTNLKKFVLFIIGFAILSLFVKNLVLLEMNFKNIFDTIRYPFEYFFEISKRIIA